MAKTSIKSDLTQSSESAIVIDNQVSDSLIGALTVPHRATKSCNGLDRRPGWGPYLGCFWGEHFVQFCICALVRRKGKGGDV